MIVTEIKSKADVNKALAVKNIHFIAAIEVVNDSDLKEATDKAKSLLSRHKKLHLIVLERA